MVPPLLFPLLFGALSHAKEESKDVKYDLKIESYPDSAHTVPADFFGFGFETAFFHKFGYDPKNPDSQRSNFSENIIKSIGGRMKAPIILRIGGTSGDLVQYKPDQKDGSTCLSGPGCPHDSRDTFSLGPGYFDTFDLFPNAHFTIQAPITPKEKEDHWIDRSTDYVREAGTRLVKKKRLAAIALGNEPNYYEYGLDTYVSRGLEAQKAAIKTLGLEGDAQRIFQLGEIANNVYSSEGGHGFGLTDVLKSKLRTDQSKFAAQHFYQVHVHKDEAVPSLQSTLMNHKAITSRFPPMKETIEHIKQNGNKIDYVISETGSAIGHADSSKGTDEVNNEVREEFAAALWAVDFHLYAMTCGVKRISNTMRPEATHSFWIPIDPYAGEDATKDPEHQGTKGPSVLGIFPSAPFIADFVGSSGKVVEVSPPGSPEYFSAYALYDENSKDVKRVALVNLKEWSKDKGDRGNAEITLSSEKGFKKGTVHRMHSDNGAAGKGYDNGDPLQGDNVTWAGQQWTFKVDRGLGHFPHGKEDEKATVKDGKVHVKVPDSEAIIVSFE